jgi:hypothetical protein
MTNSPQPFTSGSVHSAGPPVIGSCVQCGTALPWPAAFCPACGTPRQVAASSPAASMPGLQPPTVKPRRRNIGLIVALVVLVVSIIGSGIALVLSQPDEDPAAAALRADAGDALAELVSLDEDLNEGLRFVEYSVLVNRIDKKFSDLDDRTPARLDDHPGMVAMNKALVEYQAALSAWSDNIDCTSCDEDEVEPTLKSHWSRASDRVGEARSALESR